MGRWSSLRPAGFTECQTYWGGAVRGETWMCGHCNTHHEINPGSGKLRALCTRCGKDVCIGCAGVCVPIEQMLLNLEAGMGERQARTYRPIIVGVTAAPPTA